MHKSFEDQLNDLIAPVTRAWTDPEIVRVTIEPGDIGETEALATLVVRVKKKKISQEN